MDNLKLEFSSPISYETFCMQHDTHFAGIYIWGFKIKNNFVPHYVGKHETCIYSRVIAHFNGIHNTAKYTVFSKDFYNALDVFSDNSNNPKISRMAQPYRRFEVELKEYLVRFRSKELKPNSTEIVRELFAETNLFVSHAKVETKKERLSCCETAVKFGLKNNTIGRSQSLQKKVLSDIRISSQGNCLQEHFYHIYEENSTVDCIKQIYHGYTK